jgi:hypothetical protein
VRIVAAYSPIEPVERHGSERQWRGARRSPAACSACAGAPRRARTRSTSPAPSWGSNTD